MSEPCAFREIAHGRAPAIVVYEDALALTFIDLRQFHPGHTLVIPRRQLADVRELDAATGAAVMATVARITAAVGKTFPNEGLSLWHSIGPAAFQEVPHLHIHVHPGGSETIFCASIRETHPSPTKARVTITRP